MFRNYRQKLYDLAHHKPIRKNFTKVILWADSLFLGTTCQTVSKKITRLQRLNNPRVLDTYGSRERPELTIYVCLTD